MTPKEQAVVKARQFVCRLNELCDEFGVYMCDGGPDYSAELGVDGHWFWLHNQGGRWMLEDDWLLGERRAKDGVR